MAESDLILAADFGTSGVKIGVVDAGFRLVARAVEPYPLSLPGPSMAEQAPEDWWSAFCRGTARLGAEVDGLAGRLSAVVFCAQMCGLVCADARGAPLRPALVWLDKRSAPLMRGVLGGFPEVAGYQALRLARWIRLANGAPSHNGMDPTGKMLWVMRHEPEVLDRTAHFLGVRDWLVRRATGEVATTADSANLTWLMDTRRGREGWSTTLARRLGIDAGRLPPIVDGATVVGALTPAAAAQAELRAGTPFVAGGGDVTATALGSGAVADGTLHLCASSSSWISGFFDRRVLSVRHAYATITASVDHRPLLIATQESAGSALEWLAETVEPGWAQHGHPLNGFYEGLGDVAADDPVFLPWLSGERVPVDDERLRGTFHGLSLRHGQRALKRAAIEGVAMNIRWGFEKVARERGVKDGPLPLVGGAAENPYLAQALADVLERQIRVGNARFAGVIGAAAMAAPAAGWDATVWDAAARAGDGGGGPVYDPRPDAVRLAGERYARLAETRRGIVKLYRRGKGGAA